MRPWTPPARSRSTAAAAERAHLEELGRESGASEVPFPPLAPKIAWITGDRAGLKAAVEALRRHPLSPIFPFEWWNMACRVAPALASVMEGGPEEANRWLGILERYRGIYAPGGPPAVSVDRLLGLLCVTAGRPEEAPAHFEEALAFCAGVRSVGPSSPGPAATTQGR